MFTRSSKFIAAGVALSTILGLAHVWVHLQVISLGYEISRETKKHHELSEHNQRLRLELTARVDPTTVERIAKNELKMVPPDPESIRVVRKDGGRRPVAVGAKKAAP